MITALKQRFSNRYRSRRAQLFMDAMQPTDEMHILDLGGGKGQAFARLFPSLRNVTISCHDPRNLTFASERFGYQTMLLDGNDHLPFADGAIDIIYCNSVIEHVTGAKADAVALFKSDHAAFTANARQKQQLFANEIRRVGKGYFVQTPNRNFLIESHSWLPLLGLLPTHWQWRVISLFNRFWPRKDDAPDWSLLNLREFSQLFPDADIVKERVGPFNKAFIAIRARRH